MDPIRSTEPASGSQPATVEPKKKKKKRKKAIPDVQAAVQEGVDVPSPDEVLLIPPNGIPGEVCLGIRENVEEFKNDFTSGHRVWSSGKLNIWDNCRNVFLTRNWEKWRKQAQPPYLPPKAEVRKSFLHYASLELHGVKVDWTTVDLSQAINTVSYERRMAARCELFRMRVRMDGRLVETMDPDEMKRSQKGNRPRKRKHMLASEKADGVPSTDNSPPMETRAVPVNPSAPINTSGVATEATGGSTDDEENQYQRTGSNTLPSIRVLEESASNLATNTMSHITLMMEERKRVQRLQVSLEERLAKIQKENLALKNKVHTLEDEKQQMCDRVALMGKPDLYELLGAKMKGFQLASHAGTVVDFQNLVLTTTQKWTGIPSLNLERFRQCTDEYPEFAPYAKEWDGWNNHCSLCKSSLGFLPSVNIGVCPHNFHFACFWKYASTKRLCPECRKALLDATYDFFCTIFASGGDDSNHAPEIPVQ
ncbi:hypothetical protein R1sor_024215 [Riccia sorocarpa]|uniref:RING-type domain-containing protein n=1 Tax=Riccia sorocarpa TaxID=122646 RepID=A0ABD3GVW4_9MARC